MPPSEFVMTTPHTIFVEKRYPTKIINDYSKNKFFNLLKIAQKGYFTFLIYDFGFLTGFEYTKEDIARIKEIFKVYIMEEGDGATFNIIEDSLEETTR
jgi:aspartate/tyrosine/aromatic aminotransferase